MPHYIPPESVTYPRVAHIHCQPVTPSPNVEQPPQYQTRSYTRRPNSISSKYADAANYIATEEENSVTHPITDQAQEYCHLIKGDEKETLENTLCQRARTARTRFWQPNRRHQHHLLQTKICVTEEKKSDLWTSRL